MSWLRRAVQNEHGNAIVETALALPMIVLIITAIWQVGLLLTQANSLTQAATAGAQVLQSDRLSATGDPCADVFAAVKGAAPTLTSSKISLTLTLNNNTPISNTSCPGKQTQLAQGGPVTLEVTYPYSFSVLGYTVSTFSGTMSSGAITEIEY